MFPICLSESRCECGFQDLEQTEIVQKFMAFMAEIIKTIPDSSIVIVALDEVFYMK